MERAIHTRGGNSVQESKRRLSVLGLLVLYGAAYPLVFVALLGPFLAPVWLILAWAAAGAGIRPRAGEIGALLSGFAFTCVAYETWARLGCTGPSCGMTTPLDVDLVWAVVGVLELLAGAAVWWLLGRSHRQNKDSRRTSGWRWYAAAVVPLMLVALALWVHVAAA